MARLWLGLEQNTTTSQVEFSTYSGSPTISSSTKRSGGYSGRISSMSSGVSMGFRYQYGSAGVNVTYIRFYVNVATLPSAENRIFITNDANNFNTPVTYITLDNTGALRLYDEDGAIGSASSALSTATWYRIEILTDVSAGAGSHVVTGRIDGTNFATSSTRSISAAPFYANFGGNLGTEAQTTGDWFFDDIAINDNSGASQNSWCGDGKVIFLRPNAAGDSNGFLAQVGGTAGSANNYTRVNENPPDDATSYNGSALLNAEDLFNCDDSGIGASDTVNVVAVGVRMADLVGADATAAFKVELIKTSGGTKAQSGTLIPNSTTWMTNTAAVPRNYPLVTYNDPDGNPWTQSTLDSMQVGYIQTATNVQTIAVSSIWVAVDYTPAVITGTSSRMMSMGMG